MNPESGVRFELRLLSVADTVSYSCEIHLPEGTLKSRAGILLSTGEVSFDGEASLPAWVTTTMHGLLRSLWRARSRDPQPWPRRLTRWRAGE